VIETRPYDVEYLTDLSQEQLREFALERTPFIDVTAQGNLNKVSRNKSRMAKFTFVIAEESDQSSYSHKVIARAEADRLIAAQRRYIEEQGQLLEVNGFLGLGPRAVGVQWLYTMEGANIAGMQQVLAFPVADVVADAAAFRPEFQVIYTPDHFPDAPGGQRILVDLDARVTYIMGPDYFGESKKSALRLLIDHTYALGGLTLHAGA
jgi:phosphoenolpyruvate carboxykinase (ATP)